MTYFIIAGEASGDLHAAGLIEQLKAHTPDALFEGLGGDRMQATGCTLHLHYREMAFMGIVAVLRHLPQIRRNFRIAERALLACRPDALVLVDYPSFNLRIASYCRKHLPETKIYYYIPPKVWAWKTWRVHKIARLCDEVWGIFPFEPPFYARYGYRCTYVGNPTYREIRRWCTDHHIHPFDDDARTDTIAILPGSRPNEISRCLPKMLSATRKVVASTEKPYRIVVAAAPGVEDTFYAPYLRGETLTRDTYRLVASARTAVVNSGTATLEAALLGCPQTAVYHIACSKHLMWLKPLIFKIPYFTLVNIIPGKEVIRELIAADFTEQHICDELRRLLNDEAYRQQIIGDYRTIANLLSDSTDLPNS